MKEAFVKDFIRQYGNRWVAKENFLPMARRPYDFFTTLNTPPQEPMGIRYLPDSTEAVSEDNYRT
jgi:hypothetical protein